MENNPVEIQVDNSVDNNIGDVLVVGGGISGIQGALDLANSGFRVFLVDKSPALGGKMSQLDKTFPSNDCSMCIESPKFIECTRHPNIEIIKKRGSWLFINLWTAILASVVIAQFEETISAIPTLAVLMPIVASMGGNGGTQTLAVMVRQLALGEIDETNWNYQMTKEVIVASVNGIIFALFIGGITYLWIRDLRMAGIIGVAMIINLIVAGVSGGLIPIVLKKFNIDPAVGSSVILTTITDVIGFFAFLGLAEMFILN